MARRSNFIEGNDNFREQNLRFVRNEFEDNINQFFGGANPDGGSNQQKPPPRDSLIVQPTPEGPVPDFPEPGRNLELDIRRQFIRELGASRMTAHALAVRSFKVMNFNLRYFQRQRFRLSVELGDSRQNVVDAEVLRAIGEAVENKEPDLELRPRTPSPPRNIDWHTSNRDNSPVRNDDRSRPRNRQGADDFQGTRDNSRGFVAHQGPERERENFNRNAGPKNDQKNRHNRNLNIHNHNKNRDEFNRNIRNQNVDEFNRNNRNANLPEINRNHRDANTQEFNRYNRNNDDFSQNNRNINPQQEFHRNANPQMEFNQYIRNENPEIYRNNRNENPQNPNTQESYRNDRSTRKDWQGINRNNRNASPQEIIRNVNRQEFNRNTQEFNHNMNSQEYNRNMNPQENHELQRNPTEMHGSQSNLREVPPNLNNLGASPGGNRREMTQNISKQRFNNNNNRGPHHGAGINDFMPNQQGNIDGFPMIDQRRDIDDNFLEPRDRQQPNPHSDFRQMQPNLTKLGTSPQIGHNYHRIVNNNQITICRQDWIEANRMEIHKRNLPNNPNLDDNFFTRHYEDQGYNDDSIMEDEDEDDDERFHRQQQQQEDFRKLEFRCPEDQGFRGPEDKEFRNYLNDRNFESKQGNIIDQRNNDPNYLGRGRNDRNERRHFNVNDRLQSNDSVAFRGSNNLDVSPKRYRHGQGPGDRQPQPANPNQNRSNRGRNAPNPRQTISQDRTMTRVPNSSGRNPRSTSKQSEDRNPGKVQSTDRSRTNQDRNPRSTSLASQSLSKSEGEKSKHDRIASRSLKSGDANLKTQNNRVSAQTKSNRSATEAKPIGAKASTSNQARNNESLESSRAGICVKSFKVNSNEKFFINVCQAPEVPAPEDVTEEELIAILESPTPGSFRVPMSISEPRHTKDRSDKTVDVCDIAINPKFLVKIQKSQLFNNFFLQIVAEAMSEKYNIQINMQKTITLNNRKFIGTLVSHRVRNDDVKRAQTGSGEAQAAIAGQDQAAITPDKSGKLVQEINEKDAAAMRNIYRSAGGGQELQYKLRARVREDTVDEIHAEIYLPNCVSSQEVNLDVGEDRILVESQKHGYVFDKFVNYRLQQDRAQALFDKTSKMLQIRIPVFTN